jgi:hypothetical protein
MYGTEIMDQIVVELLTQKIDKVDEKVDSVANDVKAIDENVNKLLQSHAEAKGGIKVGAYILNGIIAIIASAVTALLTRS